MSFGVTAAGRVPDAIDQVKAADCYGDASQFEAVRALVLAELEAWPDEETATSGVLVEASGHHGTDHRTLSLTIRPLHLPHPTDQNGASDG